MAQALSAQSFIEGIMSRTTFGLKAGGNYSDFTNAGFDTEGLAGFHVGGMINFRLGKNFSIQEDILYSTAGAKLKNDGPLSGKAIKLSYISIPILLRYSTNAGLFIEAGPQANMLIRDAKDTGFQDFADKVDAGIAGGIGYQLKGATARGLGIGARYYKGFMDVGKFNSTAVKKDFNNSVAQVSIFYGF